MNLSIAILCGVLLSVVMAGQLHVDLYSFIAIGWLVPLTTYWTVKAALEDAR